jgi:hypothetical protein
MRAFIILTLHSGFSTLFILLLMMIFDAPPKVLYFTVPLITLVWIGRKAHQQYGNNILIKDFWKEKAWNFVTLENYLTRHHVQTPTVLSLSSGVQLIFASLL